MSNTLKVRVHRKLRAAAEVFAYELTDMHGEPLPPFSAGSHVDVHLPGGLVRQYSLCNNPVERHRYVIAVLKASPGRGGSAAMHEQVNEGDLLTIGTPRNHFALAAEATGSLLFAGGIGITPIISMADALTSSGADFELHYCARSKDRAAFVDKMLSSAYAHRVGLHLDDGDDAQRLQLEASLARPQPGVHVYVCGPSGFIDGVLVQARQCGWREDRERLATPP